MHQGQPFLNADELRAATFVRHVEIHDTLGSTNDRAAQLARDVNLELPVLVVARHQTAGKGRGGNVWWSADGALTFSVLLEPEAMGIKTANWPQLSLATAVAVCDALKSEIQRAGASSPPSGVEDDPARSNPTTRLGIKWPNDVMLDGRKVSGILIESPGGAAPAKDRLIVGIGINVNNSWRKAPPIAGAAGAALCDAIGWQHGLDSILIHFLQAMHRRLEQLRCRNPELPIAWQRLCMLTGKAISVDSGIQRTTGHCLGMESDGALIVETMTGRRSIYSGSIRPDNLLLPTV